MRHEDLYAIQWRDIRQAAFAWVDNLRKIKHTTPTQVVMGIAVTFLLVCARFKLDPREVLNTADRVIRRCKDVDPQYIRAIEQYFKEELQDS